ncbi:MAG: hypothetical protein CL557_12485 [Alphaproteobacteria bacterium]|nr:hypothetical protein [Alphaproteobacteria bacterium]|tara:strand:+ start:3866 stop:4141 length:276 start_codon:yes stop_codon:yes gene_type:complete
MEETFKHNTDHYLRIVYKHSKVMHEIEVKENEVLSISERLEDISEIQIDEKIKAKEKRKLLRKEIADLRIKARNDKGLMKWLLMERTYEPI